MQSIAICPIRRQSEGDRREKKRNAKMETTDPPPWWPKAEKRAAATMVLLHQGKRYAPRYPDGSFDPPVEPKRRVRIDWARAEQAAEPAEKISSSVMQLIANSACPVPQSYDSEGEDQGGLDAQE